MFAAIISDTGNQIRGGYRIADYWTSSDNYTYRSISDWTPVTQTQATIFRSNHDALYSYAFSLFFEFCKSQAEAIIKAAIPGIQEVTGPPLLEPKTEIPFQDKEKRTVFPATKIVDPLCPQIPTNPYLNYPNIFYPQELPGFYYHGLVNISECVSIFHAIQGFGHWMYIGTELTITESDDCGETVESRTIIASKVFGTCIIVYPENQPQQEENGGFTEEEEEYITEGLEYEEA